MTIIEERRQAATIDTAERNITPTVAGWFDDPEALHRMRYFDGNGWTAHVTHFGPTPCSGCC